VQTAVPDPSLFRRNKKEALEHKYQGVSGWTQFTDEICSSAAIKRALHVSQDGCCADCGNAVVSRSLDDSVIHHLSYDHRCTFGGNATQHPDCKDCIAQAPQKAAACLRLLRLVHIDCHEALHAAEENDPVWRRALGLNDRTSARPLKVRRFHKRRSAGP